METITRLTRFLRWGVLAAALLAVAGVVPAMSASAAQPDAADFAADCNDDGVVSVSGTQRYVGGVGTISAYCRVDLTTDASLVLRNVELTGTSLVSGLNTVENATITVIDSVITMFDPGPSSFGGVLELSTGGEADEPGANGRIVIRGSTITAGAILIATSFDWPDGSVTIKDSTLATTFGDLTVRASFLNGSNGTVKIVGADLSSAANIEVSTGLADFVGPGGGLNGLTKVTSSSLVASSGRIDISSGQGGQTKVRKTTLTASAVTVATGAGGTCQSSGNTPVTVCT